MTTMTSTDIPRHHRQAADDGRQHRRSRSSRPGARAFALGATIALVCAAIAWAAVAGLHHDATRTNAADTPAAVHPATTSESAGTATGGSSGAGTAAGSGAAPAAGTGTSYPANQDVLALQRDLGQLNYYESPIDGVNGPATVAAIKDFQRANGLPVDGIAGPATMAKIQQQMVTGDNQMGPSGPPVKPANTTASTPANTTPSKPANTTASTPANGTAGHSSQANGQSGTASGGAAAGTSTGGAAAGTSTGAGA